MKPDAGHIQTIKVVSNTHWDREFRRSFEKTRRRLLDMMDVTLDILERDEAYHSFTLDGHAILIEDYLEMRPERRDLVARLLGEGRLVAGPWLTLPEQFSITGEAIVRNFLWGRKVVEAHGGKVGPVAYTPASWGQTGQLPQILAEFDQKYMMFYRGISHDEADAEWVWQAPDGSEVLASRFALYARYNWYYQVHRPVTTGRVFAKDSVWGERDEAPFRFADGLAGEDLAFDLKRPRATYDKSTLQQAVLDMVEREGRHFTTPIFLAMHGHDISVAHPLESQIIADAKELLADHFEIKHTDLADFWAEVEQHVDRAALPTLVGERRSYLKQGMWTYLFPGTISARTYLKQHDFEASVAMSGYAEPLACLAAAWGAEIPRRYLDRGWRYLLSNHTHDANGGCAPDVVGRDMQYRYRKAVDIGEIVAEDAMAHIAANLSGEEQDAEVMQLVVYNPLPRRRDAVVMVDLEIPRQFDAEAFALHADGDPDVPMQPISHEKSSSFVDSIWDVPTILESNRVKQYAKLSDLPGVGWRTYRVGPAGDELRPPTTLVTGPTSMANEHLAVTVNGDGTIDVTARGTGRTWRGLNFLTDEGEAGNAWQHQSPTFDRKYSSRGAAGSVAIVESGPLAATIEAEYRFAVPADYDDGTRRSDRLVELPVKVAYRLEAGAREIGVTLHVDNRARDHWLRANFPTGIDSNVTVADSHFDIVERQIALPDSTGWVEQARGTHPLRTFVAMSDHNDTLAVMPRGLFEYEAFDDDDRTLALTLIRACRIKLAVSEEKQTELPDPGVQCPGEQGFEYAIAFGEGDWRNADLLSRAAARHTPVRAAMVGRGHGDLPLEGELFSVQAKNVQVTAVKPAEDGRGIIVRLFNGIAELQSVALAFGRPVHTATRCRMDETDLDQLAVKHHTIELDVEAKKIVSVRVELEATP